MSTYFYFWKIYIGTKNQNHPSVSTYHIPGQIITREYSNFLRHDVVTEKFNLLITAKLAGTIKQLKTIGYLINKNRKLKIKMNINYTNTFFNESGQLTAFHHVKSPKHKSSHLWQLTLYEYLWWLDSSLNSKDIWYNVNDAAEDSLKPQILESLP